MPLKQLFRFAVTLHVRRTGNRDPESIDLSSISITDSPYPRLLLSQSTREIYCPELETSWNCAAQISNGSIVPTNCRIPQQMSILEANEECIIIAIMDNIKLHEYANRKFLVA